MENIFQNAIILRIFVLSIPEDPKKVQQGARSVTGKAKVCIIVMPD